MHIVFFNRSYHPDPEASGQFLTELAEDLAARGERVSVVCGRSYHARDRCGLRPLRITVRNDVRVIRVSSTRLPKSAFPLRLVNLASYLAGCLLALLFLRRPDIVVSQTDPPLLPLLAGAYGRLAGARFVFTINDLYPDVAVELGEISSPLWLRLLEVATGFGLRVADRVVVLGEDMRAKVIRNGCPPGKIALVRSWVDPTCIAPRKKNNTFRRENGLSPSEFVVMYSGNLGLSQNLEHLLHAAKACRDVEGLRFVIVGEGARKGRLRHLAEQLQLDGKVLFLPYQPKERLAESLSAADLHFIPLARGVAGSIVPSKVYGIMASGTAYLAAMDSESEVASIGRRHGCGLWCQPDCPDRLKERVEFALGHRRLLRAMGRNGRRAAEGEFSRAAATGRYHELLASLV